MDVDVEFDKVRSGFLKVKEDINYLNSNMERVNAQKADRITTEQIMFELSKLRDIIVELSLNGNSVNNQEDCQKLQVLGNSDSKKVHYSNCPFAKRITKEHRVIFESVPDALNHKYNKCSCVL